MTVKTKNFLAFGFAIACTFAAINNAFAQEVTEYPPGLAASAYFQNASTLVIYGTYSGGTSVYTCPIDGPFGTSYAYELRDIYYDILGTALNGEIVGWDTASWGHSGECGDYAEWRYNYSISVDVSSLAPGTYTIRVNANSNYFAELTETVPFTIPAVGTVRVLMGSGIDVSWQVEPGGYAGVGASTLTDVPANINYTIGNFVSPINVNGSLWDFDYVDNGSGGNLGSPYTQYLPHGGTITYRIFYRLRGTGTPAPTATISASPNPVTSGSATTLTWSSTNADSCSVTQGAGAGFNTSNAASGSDATGAITSATTFAISCSGAGGTATASINVSLAAVSADIRADNSNGPTVMKSYGSTAQITWTSTNAGSCTVTASGSPTGWAAGASGSGTTPVLTGLITYVLTCSGASDQVAVNVPPPPTNPAANCPSPGNSATVSWSPPAGYSNFLLRVYDSDGTQTVYRDDFTGSSHSFPTIPGHTYNWWVHAGTISAYSVSIGGSFSCQTVVAMITFDVTYTLAPMGTPILTSLDNSACGSITVNWSYTPVAGDPIQYFSIWRGTTTGNYGAAPIWTSEGSPNATTVRSWTDSTVGPNTIYYYIVKAEEETPALQSNASNERSAMSAGCLAVLSANMRIIRVDGANYSSSSVIKDGSRLTYQLIIGNAGTGSASITSICDVLSPNLYRSSGPDISPTNISVSGTNAVSSGIAWGSGQCSGLNSVRLGVTGTKLPASLDATNWAVTFDTVYRPVGTTASYEVCSNRATVNYTDGEGVPKSVQAAVPGLCKTGKNVSPDFREVSP